MTEQELCTAATLERIASGRDSLRRVERNKAFCSLFSKGKEFETSSDFKGKSFPSFEGGVLNITAK